MNYLSLNEIRVKGHHHYLNLYRNILSKFENGEQITLITNQKFKQIQNYLINLNLNELNEENMIHQELKIIGEKILSTIKGKKEFEYVSDYFNIDSYDEDDLEHTENEKEDNNIFQNDINIEEANEDYFKSIHSLIKLQNNNQNTIVDLLNILSYDFLKNKLNLEEDEIKNIKGNYLNEEEKVNEVISQKNENINEEKSVINSKSLKPKNFLDEIKLTKSTRTTTKSSITTRASSNIEKEIEEEINNEIFSYTKNMKQYARSFNEVLNHDNKKLDKIEKNQDNGQTKTDKSMKSLNEFNYNIKIGFWKLLLMFIIVIVSFIMTLLSIRIFPRLVK